MLVLGSHVDTVLRITNKYIGDYHIPFIEQSVIILEANYGFIVLNILYNIFSQMYSELNDEKLAEN